MSRTRFHLLFGGLLVCLAGAACAAGWGGVYVYEGAFGRSAGGTPILVRYEIHFDDRDGTCHIAIEGFQTEEELLCEGLVVGNGLTLRFRSYGDGSMANRHGVALYRPGAPLLELRRAGKGGADGIETRWVGLRTLDGKAPEPGRYFMRRQ